jgi:hypothetical protein
LVVALTIQVPGALDEADSIRKTRSTDTAIDLVPVTKQILRRAFPWERFDDLLRGPLRGWIAGDVEMEDATAIVSKNEEHVQNLVAHSRYHEEVDGDDLLDVVLEERTPSRGGRCGPADHIFLDRRFGDDDTDQLWQRRYAI